jgi:hypothetical protein
MSENHALKAEQPVQLPAVMLSGEPKGMATDLLSEMKGTVAPPAVLGPRTFIMNGFARDPIDTYSPAFAEGERIGEAIASGDSLTAAQELSQYVQQLERTTTDPEALAAKEANVFAGMQAANPSDVHLIRQGDKVKIDIDFSTKLPAEECEE